MTPRLLLLDSKHQLVPVVRETSAIDLLVVSSPQFLLPQLTLNLASCPDQKFLFVSFCSQLWLHPVLHDLHRTLETWNQYQALMNAGWLADWLVIIISR